MSEVVGTSALPSIPPVPQVINELASPNVIDAMAVSMFNEFDSKQIAAYQQSSKTQFALAYKYVLTQLKFAFEPTSKTLIKLNF